MAEDLKDALKELENFEPEIEEEELPEDTDDDSDDDNDSDSDTDTDTDNDTDTDTDTDDDDAKKDLEIAELKGKIDQLTQLVNTVVSGKKQDVEEPDTSHLPEIEIPDWDEENLVPDDFDVETYTAKDLNVLLNKAASAGMKKASKIATTHLLRLLPQLIKHNVSVQTTVQAAVSEFYKSNNDLAPFKAVVKHVAEELHGNNPDWSVEKLFSEAGKETRKRLNLSALPKKKAGEKPPVAKPKGQKSREIPDVKGLEGEIGAMIGSLNR